jgi:glycosyltransferase involved in cell wall biosynthesis
MWVTVDARMAFHTGIGRYIRSLYRALLQQSPDLNLSLLVDPLQAKHTQREIGPSEIIPFPAKIYSVKEQLYGLQLAGARVRHTTLFHFPHYNVPWFLPRHSVVTIHDLTHFQYPQLFGRRVWLAFRLLQRAIQRAGHIITVSQATRQALETFLPTAKGKTTVIYHGVASHFRPLPAEVVEDFKRATQLQRCLLYIGSAKPHKNLPRLLQAFARVRAQCPHVELVMLGVEPSVLLEHPTGIRTYHCVSDEHLVRWYNAAEALILPSLNEGFGLPTLEAMACGTPVIASNVAALPEVVGDAGLLVNPWDVEALAQAIGRLLVDHDLRHDLREKGLKRAQCFSWAKTAEQTLKVYREVALW